MKTKYTLFALLATLLTIPQFAVADREEIQMLSQAKISLCQAVATAEKHIGGSAISAELDDDSFTPTFEVSVVKDGKLFDVQIDGVNGTVTGSREDLD